MITLDDLIRWADISLTCSKIPDNEGNVDELEREYLKEAKKAFEELKALKSPGNTPEDAFKRWQAKQERKKLEAEELPERSKITVKPEAKKKRNFDPVDQSFNQLEEVKA